MNCTWAWGGGAECLPETSDQEISGDLPATKICFGSTKMEIFYREKAFHAGKKIRKNDFAPSEKFSCYAPAQQVRQTQCFQVRIK